MNTKLALKELKVKSFKTTDKVLGGLQKQDLEIDIDLNGGSGVTRCHLGSAAYNLCCV